MEMKTYYVGGNETGDFELFSVLERPNPDDSKYKDLQLHFPGKGLFFTSQDFREVLKTDDEEKYDKADSPHISIHYNPSQSYLLIKKTLVAKKVFQVSRVKDVRDKMLFAPVILKIYGDTSQDYFITPKKHLNSSSRVI
ncbi:hypothetical protein L6273_01525 [Candidatus Parcubacteria bacterium]|nr:hypothetical protein [Candidatus Parcubacteria bacterium]